jgi:SAM-dependent methyltransferase
MHQSVRIGLQRATGLFPPPLRRAAAGLWLDVLSLPARLRDPERRSDPWQTQHNVGGGDFRAAGDMIVSELLVGHAGLQPNWRVLDMGCGSGRVALPLVSYLGADGGYLGFDVSRRAINACRRRLAVLRPDFQFVWLNLASWEFNAGGDGDQTAARFPCQDGCFDLAFATSLFSHMTMEAIRRYLVESARVLRPGGRLLFTAYGLTSARRETIAAGRAGLGFRPWRKGSMVIDARSPERAIAHDADLISDALAEAGLVLSGAWLAGAWAGDQVYSGWQDVWLAEKP